MSTKRLLIHAGYPKTGTSALQVFLYKNRTYLLEQGFIYPEIKSNYYPHCHVCISPEISDSLAYSDITSDVYQKFLLEEIDNSTAHTAIVSNELIFYSTPSTFDYLINRYDTYIFCYLRPHVSYINGLMCQQLKKHQHEAFWLFDSGDNGNLLWKLKMKREEWITALGIERFSFRNYEQIKDKNQIAEEFCEYAGIKIYKNFLPSTLENISPSGAFHLFMLHLALLPMSKNDYDKISIELEEIDNNIRPNFCCNVVPKYIFKNATTELITELDRQGQLLNAPGWTRHCLEKVDELNDFVDNLPPSLQHEYFDKLSDECKAIIIKHFPKATNTDINVSILPSIVMPTEQFWLIANMRKNFILQRIENDKRGVIIENKNKELKTMTTLLRAKNSHNEAQNMPHASVPDFVGFMLNIPLCRKIVDKIDIKHTAVVMLGQNISAAIAHYGAKYDQLPEFRILNWEECAKEIYSIQSSYKIELFPAAERRAFLSKKLCIYAPRLKYPWSAYGMESTISAVKDIGIYGNYLIDSSAFEQVPWAKYPTIDITRKYLDDNVEKIVQIFNNLADVSSREVFAGALRARMDGDIGYIPLSSYPEYHHPLLKAEQGDFIIEGGVGEGDSTIKFSDAVGDTGRVFAFEPDPVGYETAKKSLQNCINVNLESYGLWSKDDNKYITNDSDGSRIIESPDASCNLCKLISIDSYMDKHSLRCNMIKLDIEGAEPYALIGAQNTIRNHLPKLAICLYHHPATQLIEIPLQIFDMNLGYKFYIGHHAFHHYATVLYALPPEKN